MAKSAVKIRGKFADEKYTGPEPSLTKESTQSETIRFFNWFNYYFSDDDAKEFTLVYLRSIKFDAKKLKALSSCDASSLRWVGWYCRCLSTGGSIPDAEETKMWERIESLIQIKNNTVDRVKVKEETSAPAANESKVISVQEKINNKAGNLIADIEDMLDSYYKTGKTFDAAKWFREKDVKAQVALKIAEYYKPLYAELYDAQQGKNPDIKEAYSHLKKAKLKEYVELIKAIIVAAEQREVIAKAVRKPRKKKVKPASDIIKKLQYLEHDKELDLKSVKPTDIVGAQQLWVYNTKYRTLAVYNAIGAAGFSVKGTTLLGFDEKTSIVKRLRKPKEQLYALSQAGKVQLRKFMDNIKCKSNGATGRINKDSVLLRVGK